MAPNAPKQPQRNAVSEYLRQNEKRQTWMTKAFDTRACSFIGQRHGRCGKHVCTSVGTKAAGDAAIAR